jgi:hypothetical protein
VQLFDWLTGSFVHTAVAFNAVVHVHTNVDVQDFPHFSLAKARSSEVNGGGVGAVSAEDIRQEGQRRLE